MKAPWVSPSDAPVIEQSIHDYIVSIFRQLTGPERKVEIVPISPGAESTRGWDAAVMQAVPLYFQYKYPDFTSRPWSSQFDAYTHRRAWAFDDSDGLFHFKLRAKAENAPKSQHEFMVDLQDSGERVFYVAPTFVDAKRLRSGGDPIYDRPWLNSRLTFRRGRLIDYPVVPYFEGLICIPPHINISAPPESHEFYFNTMYEVSLHSDPVVVEAKSIEQVITNQLDVLYSSQTQTNETIGEYVEDILRIIATKNNEDAQYTRLREYFRANVSQSEAAQSNPLMQQMRGLAKVLRKLYGIEMLLTTQRV